MPSRKAEVIDAEFRVIEEKVLPLGTPESAAVSGPSVLARSRKRSAPPPADASRNPPRRAAPAMASADACPVCGDSMRVAGVVILGIIQVSCCKQCAAGANFLVKLAKRGL